MKNLAINGSDELKELFKYLGLYDSGRNKHKTNNSNGYHGDVKYNIYYVNSEGLLTVRPQVLSDKIDYELITDCKIFGNYLIDKLEFDKTNFYTYKEEIEPAKPFLWAIKGSEKLSEWEKTAMGGNCNKYLNATNFYYYSEDENLRDWYDLTYLKEGYTEIDFEEFVTGIFRKVKLPEIKRIVVSKSNLEKIHDVACDTWQERIIKLAQREPFSDSVKLNEKEVDEMFKASNPSQLQLLERIFGKRDKSVDLTDFNLNNGILNVRDSHEYKNKGFYLSNGYNWEIKQDSGEVAVLIPTRK
jgi:hypothetical protein